MAKKTNSQGFSLIAGIVIVLAIASIGLGGWYVWDKNQKDDTNKSDKTSQNNQNENEEEEEPIDPSEGGKYLVIKEWGVRFLLPEEFRSDIAYGIRIVSSTNQEAASFEIGEIIDLPNSNCELVNESDGSGKSGGIGVMLIRSPETVPTSEGIGSSVFTSSDGKYHYYVAPSKGLCAPIEYEQTELDAASSLENALKGVEEAPTQ